MDDRLEHRVLELLRDTHGASLPLRRLHGWLIAEAGPTVGAYARFTEEIRGSRAFVVIDPEDPLGDSCDWPPELRLQYENALAAAGVERGPRLALAAPPPGLEREPPSPEASQDAQTERPLPARDAPIAALRASLLEAWAVAGPDTDLRAAIATAFEDCAELHRLSDNG